jgi:adenosylcobinamide-GDP ribazoletransferase
MLSNVKNGFLLAMQFFTIIPYHKEIPWNDKTISWCLRLLPLIGLLIGLAGYLQVWMLIEFTAVSPLILSFWIMFFLIAITGGLHLDGWMDCSDAFFSYRNREQRLQIMDDPRVGSFAVLSVIFLLVFRYLFIYETILNSLSSAFLGILAIPILTRWMVVWLLLKGKLAKETGLAASFQKGVSPKTIKPITTMVFLLIVIIGFWQESLWILIAVVFAGLVYLLISFYFSKKQFGGITGDTLGATIEGGETFLWWIVWLSHFFVTA